MIRQAFPRHRLAEAQPLDNGLRNTNLKLRFESLCDPVVLRIYEHDTSLCQKEFDLLPFVASSVPVPEVIHAAPQGLEELPPFALMKFVEGISFRELRRGGDTGAIAQASFSAGETLAAIGRIRFPKPGWIRPGPDIGVPLLEGLDPIPRFIDLCLASDNLKSRLPADLRDRIHELVWAAKHALAALGAQTHLVHGDFNKRNLLVRREVGEWKVVAVLDWEFAVSGSPLMDLGNFLRYETADHPCVEPHFSSGYLHGGGLLPPDWGRLARLIDLTAVCPILASESPPDSVSEELLGIVRATASPGC